MTKLQLGLSAIVVGGLAVTVAIQHQTAGKMRGENLALLQQVAGLAADNESLSNRLGQVRAPSQSADDQFRELLRLRGEVGRLREQTNLAGKQAAENRRLQSSVVTNAHIQVMETAKFLEHRDNVVHALKTVGLAMRSYADNNGQYPANLTQCSNELGNVTHFTGDIELESFELVNVGKIDDRYPQAISAREQAPRQSPLGDWERIYLFHDGSVHRATSADGNFDAWERDNAQPIPAAGQ